MFFLKGRFYNWNTTYYNYIITYYNKYAYYVCNLLLYDIIK